MVVRTRRDVWKLSLGSTAAAEKQPWNPVLDAYARGVAAMMKLSPQVTVDSWIWAANTHGIQFGTARKPLWDQCEHGSPFFLPWHRAYLAWFEKTLRTHLKDDTWALPYWDYSDPSRPETRDLPPEFRVKKRTVNGALVANPLYVPGRVGKPPASDVNVVPALSEPMFIRSMPQQGFGGLDGGVQVGGAVEDLPHNYVHGDIGGLMGATTTAGQDPIFWLHHANIDRLWEVWRSLPGSVSVLDQQGVSAQLVSEWKSAKFRFGTKGATTSYAMKDLVDTTAAPLGYKYESTTLPKKLLTAVTTARSAATTTSTGAPMGLDDIAPEPRWQPAAAADGLQVGGAGAQRDIDLGAGQMGLDDTALPTGVIIELAGVQSDDPHHVYVVDIGIQADGTMRRAGRFSTFGLGGVADAKRTFLIDASPTIPALVQDGWTGGTLSVRVLPDPDRSPADAAGIRIEQITVYTRP